MAGVEELSVVLPPDLLADLRLAAANGGHGSVNDIVREALEAWRHAHGAVMPAADDLRRLVREGIDSGPGLDADEVFTRLRARYGRPTHD
jgi:antitoxin ParD1/3/4